MTDQPAEPEAGPDQLEQALTEVVNAARAHLAAVRAADGVRDDDRVWRGYLALARATAAYDRLLYQRYGESTPWELPWEDVPPGTVTPAEPVTSADPYPQVVTVRHQRDYRVPSVSALLAVARRAGQRSRWERGTPEPDTVGAAVLELVMDGDGSLGSLDLPELEPLGGLVTVAERSAAGTGERLLARLEERPEPPLAPGAADGGPEPTEPGGG